MMSRSEIEREALMIKEMGFGAIVTMIERYERHIESLQFNQDSVAVLDRFMKYLCHKERLLMDEMAEKTVKATISLAARDLATEGEV